MMQQMNWVVSITRRRLSLIRDLLWSTRWMKAWRITQNRLKLLIAFRWRRLMPTKSRLWGCTMEGKYKSGLHLVLTASIFIHHRYRIALRALTRQDSRFSSSNSFKIRKFQLRLQPQQSRTQMHVGVYSANIAKWGGKTLHKLRWY